MREDVEKAENEKYKTLMSDRKQLVNELADYNLLLLRKIYDAYEERADKVLLNFRSDKNNVLRKRYMVPIINPNYDYENLLKEMKFRDREEEDSVRLDGETVCEEFEKQLMEAIMEETGEDLGRQRVDRQRVDQFGQPLKDWNDDEYELDVPNACFEIEERALDEDGAGEDEFEALMREL